MHYSIVQVISLIWRKKKQGARLCQASGFFFFVFFFFCFFFSFFFLFSSLFPFFSPFLGGGAEGVCLYEDHFLMFCESIDGLQSISLINK